MARDLNMTLTQQQMVSGAPNFKGCSLLASGAGGGRDEDGIDRVGEIPEKLKPFLMLLKENCKAEGINLQREFQDAGASCYGAMAKTMFCSQLVTTFKRFRFTAELLAALTLAYGIGLPDHKMGGFKEVGWLDFVEDVNKIDCEVPSSVAAYLNATFGGDSHDGRGGIDLVPDPKEALKKWLLTLKCKNQRNGIDLMYNFRVINALADAAPPTRPRSPPLCCPRPPPARP